MSTQMLEPVDVQIAGRINEVLDDDEEVLIRATTDLDENRRFGRQCVVVTNRRLWVLPESDGQIFSVPVEQIVKSRTEPLVGGGHLEIERRGEPTLYIGYTDSQAVKFSEITRGLEQLRQGNPFLINPQLDKLRCDNCGRLLPEKNSICPACIRKRETLKRIAVYLLPYKLKAAVIALAFAVMAGTQLLPPLVTRHLVDDVLVPVDGTASMDERVSLLGLLVLALIGLRLLNWSAEWVHGWTAAWLGAQVVADIRGHLYRCLEMLSMQFYDKREVGTLLSRASRDVGLLHDFLIDGLPYIIINGLLVFGILGFLLWMSVPLTLYVLIPVPFLIAWGFVFWPRMRTFFSKWSQVWASLTDRTVETLTGIRVVKAFAQEKREMTNFARPNLRLREVAQQTEINRGVFFATITFLTGLGMLIVWLLGGQQVLDGRITLGTLLAFYAYMWLLYGPLEWFGQIYVEMTRAFASAERIFEVIDAESESFEAPDAVRLPRMQGHIRFRDVTFGYDKSKPVLHGINLDVKPGEMIGLVGKSGVGKTTTINLIARFYDPDQGTIEIDDVDVNRLNLHDLRSQIGIVLQEPMLFSGTIAENISYGRHDATFAQIVDAARSANAHNFILGKDDGYDTSVGEKGAGLSVGECQRISIARALLHNPRILILDEATASVDVATEQQIQQALGKLTEGRTTIAIAHRLSTLRNADRLVVLDQGRIVEQGTHTELMAKRGVFYDLVQLQQAMDAIIATRE